jgi:hypothetical protein
MEFAVTVVTLKGRPNLIPLRLVWNIDNTELSRNGANTLEHLESSAEPIQAIYRDVCWQGQALLEFQDLQEMPLPRRGRFMNLAYLYCESINTLRQVVICGLNGQVQAALAALRSSLEALVYQYWWRRKLFGADDYEPFYDWLFGKERKGPTLAQVIRDTLKNLVRPQHAVIFDGLESVYTRLCSYAHKALLEEAILKVRGGNAPQSNDQEILYWLLLLHKTQRCMLDVAVLSSPLSVFPVNVYRKFGFNPPLGVFMDEFGAYAIEKALGGTAYNAYREHLKNREPTRSHMEWYDSKPDLTEEQVLASWHEETPGEDPNGSFEEKVLMRATIMKAKMRASLWTITYQEDTMVMPDIRELMRDIEKALSGQAQQDVS